MHQFIGLGHSGGNGLFHQHLAAGGKCVPDHGKMLGGGDRHAHGIHQRQEFPVVYKIPGVQGVSHLMGLVMVQIGHPYQFRFRQRGILFGVKPAQISHADDTHFYRFGHLGHPVHIVHKRTRAPE